MSKNQEENKKIKQENIEVDLPQKEKKKTSKETDSFVFQRIENVDIKKGLSNEEANNRILHHYNNENNIKTTKSGWKILKDNIFTFFNILYLIITVILCFANSWSNLTFLPIVIANVVTMSQLDKSISSKLMLLEMVS